MTQQQALDRLNAAENSQNMQRSEKMLTTLHRHAIVPCTWTLVGTVSFLNSELIYFLYC